VLKARIAPYRLIEKTGHGGGKTLKARQRAITLNERILFLNGKRRFTGFFKSMTVVKELV